MRFAAIGAKLPPMTVKKERRPGHDRPVAQLQVQAKKFDLDVALARLASEGVEVVRSSPDIMNVRYGELGWSTHTLVFEEADRAAVEEALRTGGLL